MASRLMSRRSTYLLSQTMRMGTPTTTTPHGDLNLVHTSLNARQKLINNNNHPETLRRPFHSTSVRFFCSPRGGAGATDQLDDGIPLSGSAESESPGSAGSASLKDDVQSGGFQDDEDFSPPQEKPYRDTSTGGSFEGAGSGRRFNRGGEFEADEFRQPSYPDRGSGDEFDVDERDSSKQQYSRGRMSQSNQYSRTEEYGVQRLPQRTVNKIELLGRLVKDPMFISDGAAMIVHVLTHRRQNRFTARQFDSAEAMNDIHKVMIARREVVNELKDKLMIGSRILVDGFLTSRKVPLNRVDPTCTTDRYYFEVFIYANDVVLVDVGKASRERFANQRHGSSRRYENDDDLFRES